MSTNDDERERERRRGYWEGRADEQFKAICHTLDLIRADLKVYDERITKNTRDVTYQRGVSFGVGAVSGFIASFIKPLITSIWK